MPVSTRSASANTRLAAQCRASPRRSNASTAGFSATRGRSRRGSTKDVPGEVDEEQRETDEHGEPDDEKDRLRPQLHDASLGGRHGREFGTAPDVPGARRCVRRRRAAAEPVASEPCLVLRLGDPGPHCLELRGDRDAEQDRERREERPELQRDEPGERAVRLAERRRLAEDERERGRRQASTRPSRRSRPTRAMPSRAACAPAPSGRAPRARCRGARSRAASGATSQTECTRADRR